MQRAIRGAHERECRPASQIFRHVVSKWSSQQAELMILFRRNGYGRIFRTQQITKDNKGGKIRWGLLESLSLSQIDYGQEI